MMNAADKLSRECFELFMQGNLMSLWERNGADWQAIIGGCSNQNAITDGVLEHVAWIIAAYLFAIGCVQPNIGPDARQDNSSKHRAGHILLWSRGRKQLID